MDKAKSKRTALVLFCSLAALLYVYGVCSASLIPNHIEDIALPLDFMVGIPLGFYLLIVRPRRLTLLSVIPVVWIGYALCVLALGSPGAGLLPYLLIMLLPIELAIAIKEVLRLFRVFKAAREKSDDPMVWFKETMLYLVRKDAPASIAAAELSVWYYALFSWRKKAFALPGEVVFSYHNAGGYMNMMLGLMLAFPVEIIGVHLLVSQWSVPAACAITALSVYAAIWLIGDARARIMRPVTVGDDSVRLECGIQMEATIPFSDIDKVCFSEGEVRDLAKAERLNYGTFYQADVWVVAKRPIEVRTMLGNRSVRAVGISIDDPVAFVNAVKGGYLSL